MNPQKKGPSVKRRKGMETKENIFKTSALLFAAKGYDDVSIREIASSINIKESSIYNHFDSKNSILTSLFDYYSDEILKARLSDIELEKLLSIMSPEDVLKTLIARLGQRIDETLDHIATIVFTERFRNSQAAELYSTLIIEKQSEYYLKVFSLMKDKGMITPSSEVDLIDFATQYNYVLVALAQEYAMAKNGMTDLSKVIKKMMDTATFFAKKISLKTI